MKFLLSAFGFNFLGNRIQFRKSFSIPIHMILLMFSANSFSASGFRLRPLFSILQYLVHLYSSVQPEGLLPVFYLGVLCWIEILLAQLGVCKNFFFISNKVFCWLQQSTLAIVVFQAWCILLPVLPPLKIFTQKIPPPSYMACVFSLSAFNTVFQLCNLVL